MDRKRGWKSWKAIVLGFVAVTIGGFLNKGWSEDLPPPAAAATPANTTQAESNDLEQRVKVLERKLEVANDNASSASSETPVIKADGKDGFQIQSADKSFALKIRALIQGDSRSFIDDNKGNETNQFLIRRARPILEGTLYGYTSFRLTPDFASNGKTVLYDAYLDVAPWSFVKLRAGKFKPPIGLEHLQSDEYLTFAERSYVSDLTPSRDTGVQLFGDFFNGALGYAASITNGVGDNNVNTNVTVPVTSDTDANDSKEGTVRIAAKPFKNSSIEPIKGLGLGLSGSFAAEATTVPNYVTPGQVAIFTPAATATSDGQHIRIEPDINYYYKSFGITGEWIQSSQVWRVGRVKSTERNQAWQANTSYVITGEDASYTGVKPRHIFDPKNKTWGAFEVAARYQELYLDPDNFTRGITTAANSIQRAQTYGVGLNWYLNNNLRFTTDFDNTTFDKGAATGDRPNEKIVISRWQICF